MTYIEIQLSYLLRDLLSGPAFGYYSYRLPTAPIVDRTSPEANHPFTLTLAVHMLLTVSRFLRNSRFHEMSHYEADSKHVMAFQTIVFARKGRP